MHRRLAIEAAKPAGIYEVFLLDTQGNLLEGATSNVYVLLDGALHTAGSGVLAGISRLILCEVCAGIVPLRMQAANMADIDRFSEVFLTSSSRGIIPVVELDGKAIGDGTVGPITLALPGSLSALGRSASGRIVMPTGRTCGKRSSWPAPRANWRLKPVATIGRLPRAATLYLQAEYADIRLARTGPAWQFRPRLSWLRASAGSWRPTRTRPAFI